MNSMPGQKMEFSLDMLLTQHEIVAVHQALLELTSRIRSDQVPVDGDEEEEEFLGFTDKDAQLVAETSSKCRTRNANKFQGQENEISLSAASNKRPLENVFYPPNFKFIKKNVYARNVIKNKTEKGEGILFCDCLKNCNDNFCYRRWKEGTYNDLQIFEIAGKGCGIKSDISFNKDQFIVEITGKIKLTNNMNDYEREYSVDLGIYYLDCLSYGNIGRFVNHSCNPNSILRKYWLEGTIHVGIFALEDIPPDEEITFKYGDSLLFYCMCGEDCCVNK